MVQLETEWTIVGDAKSWMDALLDRHGADAPFLKVKLETRTAGSLKRRDLTILDRNGGIALTGEVKVPYAFDGASPFVESTVVDARKKALSAGAPWFFTWNLNELVLWKTDNVADLRGERGFKTYAVTAVRRREDLESPHVQLALRNGIELFLLDFMRIFTGLVEVARRAPDEYFVHTFDSFLTLPILNATRALIARDKTPTVREALNRWMRDEQGWTLVGDRDELLARAAKFAVYGVANKLVFYDALRKRFSDLPSLIVDKTVDTGEKLIDKFASFFDTARHETGDYETIFGTAAGDIGARIPFYDDVVVAGWTQFAEQIDRFDLSRLDYDVIGRIFERLIDPAERHKYGQYYTRPQVVDLINAFAIRRGEDIVLDPGCGGGTFLVRAYARKRRLAPRLSHAALLDTIYGTDISPFAANLSTINLATRDLVEAANYPRVARKDFFETAVGATLMRLPGPEGSSHAVAMPRFDAIVGNPPYVRQEDVPDDLKQKYRQSARDAGLHPNGRSDLHVYFWGHALALLKPDGRLGFLASSQWLDAEYGFALQGFLLENFRIDAIVESRNEPWFVGARVATVATMATRESDPAARDDNIVRFVELDRPIADLLAHDGSANGALEAAETFRDLILDQRADADFDGWRVRVQRQGDIRARGVLLGERTKGRSVYAGDKWGIPLRAPEIWHDLLRIGGDRWRPLADLAEVRFGVKSGADAFFYVEDWSARGLIEFPDADMFADHYGVARNEVFSEHIALARTDTGEVHPIEREYLQPIVHSLMSIDSYRIERRHCAKLALMAKDAYAPYLARYVTWGERHGYDKGATCQQRASGRRAWYDLTPDAESAEVLWVKERQYRFAALYNPKGYTANCRLYTVSFRDGVNGAAQAAVLNSSIGVLSTLMYGRPVGVEANWSTMVLDTNMLCVPSTADATTNVRKRLTDAHDRMTKRGIIGFLSERRLRRKSLVERGRGDRLDELSDETELDQTDRQALDDAVLELLGLTDRAERRAVRDRLYDHLRRYFEGKRVQEEEAIDNKRRTAAAHTLGPGQVAVDVFAEIERDHPALRRTYIDLTRGSAEGDGVRIPAGGEPHVVDDLVTRGVRFGAMRGGDLVITRDREQAELVSAIASIGPRGRSVFVPFEGARVRELIGELRAIESARTRIVRELVTARTTDPDIVDQAIEQVLHRLQAPVARVARPAG